MKDTSYVHITIIIGMNVFDNLNSVKVINKPGVCTRTMCLSALAALRCDREHLIFKVTLPTSAGNRRT
jgi:hypothetical protein